MMRACLFDMDGLLFDTERMGGYFMGLAVARQGFSLTEERFLQLLGCNMDKICAKLDEWYDGKIDHYRFGCDWRDVTLDHMREHGMPLRPYANEILRDLRARGIKLALCTSNTTEVTHEYLRIAGWEDAFDAVVTGQMVEHGKPAPDVYLKAAELIGVAPDECAGCEDSPGGLRAVRSAGMCSVMIPDRVPYSEELAPYVDLCLNSLAELEKAVFDKE